MSAFSCLTSRLSMSMRWKCSHNNWTKEMGQTNTAGSITLQIFLKIHLFCWPGMLRLLSWVVLRLLFGCYVVFLFLSGWFVVVFFAVSLVV
jgi:hypothetical protein